MQGVPRDQVARVARIYHRNADACAALGITLRSFSRLCKRFGIETPYTRRLRALEASRRCPVVGGD